MQFNIAYQDFIVQHTKNCNMPNTFQQHPHCRVISCSCECKRQAAAGAPEAPTDPLTGKDLSRGYKTLVSNNSRF